MSYAFMPSSLHCAGLLFGHDLVRIVRRHSNLVATPTIKLRASPFDLDQYIYCLLTGLLLPAAKSLAHLLPFWRLP